MATSTATDHLQAIREATKRIRSRGARESMWGDPTYLAATSHVDAIEQHAEAMQKHIAMLRRVVDAGAAVHFNAAEYDEAIDACERAGLLPEGYEETRFADADEEETDAE